MDDEAGKMDQSVEIYDNGGKTLDRYTVVIGSPVTPDKWVYMMSATAGIPGGVDEDGGPSYMWNFETCGNKIDLSELPLTVQRAIAWRKMECLTRDWEVE